MIERATRAVLDAQQPLLGRLDTLDALRAWRDLLVDLQARRQCRGGCPLGTLASELCETWPDTRDDLADGFARWREPIRAGLRAMHARGELRPGADPDTLALLAALQGGLLLTKVQRDTAPLEAALDTMIDQIASTCSAAPDELYIASLVVLARLGPGPLSVGAWLRQRASSGAALEVAPRVG